MTAPPPSDAEVVGAAWPGRRRLRAAPGGERPRARPRPSARRLAAALDTPGQRRPPAMRAQGRRDAACPPFDTMLDPDPATRCRPQPVTLPVLPPELVRDWIDGRRPRAGLDHPQGQLQQQRGAEPLHRRGRAGRARRHRHAGRHPRRRPHRGRRLHRGRRAVVRRHHRFCCSWCCGGCATWRSPWRRSC